MQIVFFFLIHIFQKISSPLPLINIQDLHCLMPDPWSTQHQPGLLSFLCCFEPLGNLICITSQPEKRGSGHQSLRVTALLFTRKVAAKLFSSPGCIRHLFMTSYTSHRSSKLYVFSDETNFINETTLIFLIISWLKGIN